MDAKENAPITMSASTSSASISPPAKKRRLSPPAPGDATAAPADDEAQNVGSINESAQMPTEDEPALPSQQPGAHAKPLSALIAPPKQVKSRKQLAKDDDGKERSGFEDALARMQEGQRAYLLTDLLPCLSAKRG